MSLKKAAALGLAALMLVLCGCAPAQSSLSDPSSASESLSSSASLPEPFSQLNWAEDISGLTLDEAAPVKNVILIIGDGMGIAHTDAARIVKGSPLALDIASHTAYVTTSNALGELTDSAAAATAMGTGVKTTNKYIGLDPDGNELPNLCDFFEARGMRTGTAVTQIMPHATPAGFFAHNEARDNYSDLFADMLTSGADVLLGGGQNSLDYRCKKLVESEGYTYISSASELESFVPGEKALGLFRYSSLAGDIAPGLPAMSAEALKLLENDKGFFLMIEESDIDTMSHGGDMDAMMIEMSVLDRTVKVCLDYAAANPGTLVMITADHETGGLTLPDGATKAQLTDALFTSDGLHTAQNVRIWAAGAQADRALTSETIDNTDIYRIITGFFS